MARALLAVEAGWRCRLELQFRFAVAVLCFTLGFGLAFASGCRGAITRSDFADGLTPAAQQAAFADAGNAAARTDASDWSSATRNPGEGSRTRTSASGVASTCNLGRTNASFLRPSLTALGFSEETPLSGPLRCAAPAPALHNDPMLFGIALDGGVKLGVGQGGQIYSIQVPGVVRDFQAPQRVDALWVDSVFQTVGTNSAWSQPSVPGRRWFYHQAGTYSRGVRSGMGAYYSPLLWHSFDTSTRTASFLHLAQMPHLQNTNYVPDRFVVFTRLRDLGNGALEVVTIWFNHSRRGANDPRSTLNFFNTPWGALGRWPTGPVTHVVAALRNGTKRDVSAARWPADAGVVQAEDVSWVGGFASATRPGVAFTIAEGNRVRLGAAEHSDSIIGMHANGTPMVGEGNFEILTSNATGPARRTEISRGETFASRYVMAFGTQSAIASRIASLTGNFKAEKVVIAQSTRPDAAVHLCRNANGVLAKCSSSDVVDLVLSTAWCSNCRPVYEIFETATRKLIYSTDPYMAEIDQSYLTDNQYRIRRIVGWLWADPTDIPAGYRAIRLNGAAGEPIATHPSDRGQAYLLPAAP